MAKPTGRPVRDEILRVTEELIQRGGVAAFSYSHIAERLGIKAPSVHHHFRRKEDLVAEVASTYRTSFAARVQEIAGPTAADRMRAFADLFVSTAADDRMCLCGAMAAEWESAGPASREQVAGFLDDQLTWLTGQISDGVASGEFRDDLDPRISAKTFLATLEGTLLLDRTEESAASISASSDLLLRLMKA